MTFGTVWVFVVGDVIDIPFRDEVSINYPWCIRDDFVYPATMPRCLATIG